MTAETMNTNLTGSTIAVKPITMSDFELIEDSIEEESRLIESYKVQLTTICAEGKFKLYKETLKTNKRRLTLKKNAYAAIISGRSCTLEYWNDMLFPYLTASNFPLTKEDYEEFPEEVRKVDKETNTVSLETVMKVRLTNNLKSAKKSQLPYIVAYILEHFNLTPELEAGFKEVLESTKTEKPENIMAGHVIKANSDLFKDGSDKAKNDFNLQLASMEKHYETLSASLSFINWKLFWIKIFESEHNIKKLEAEKIAIAEKIAKRVKEDKKFASLVSVAHKWSL